MLNSRGFSFRFRWIPALVSLALIIVGLSLAQWQTRRALEKEHIAEAMAQRQRLPALQSLAAMASPKELIFRRATLKGEFIADWPLYLDNRPLHGVAGFYVLMPFKPHDSDKYVLIARGWQARNPLERTRLPALVTPTGEIEIEGIIRDGVDRVMQLGVADTLRPGVIIQNLDLTALKTQTKMNFAPFVIEQTSALEDGLQRDWPLPSAGADRHRGYAFQWWALSVMALLFFVITGCRRGTIR